MTVKVLTPLAERLTKNPGNFIKMLTESRMLTQISLRTPKSRHTEMSLRTTDSLARPSAGTKRTRRCAADLRRGLF